MNVQKIQAAHEDEHEIQGSDDILFKLNIFKSLKCVSSIFVFRNTAICCYICTHTLTHTDTNTQTEWSSLQVTAMQHKKNLYTLLLSASTTPIHWAGGVDVHVPNIGWGSEISHDGQTVANTGDFLMNTERIKCVGDSDLILSIETLK